MHPADSFTAIVVTVHNELDEGTAIHWHGFLQKNSQPFDGVPGISVCPIAPGKSFTYTFIAELYGSSWWHSHYSSQYASGLTGPIVIHGPQNVAADIDLGPVLVTDWYHAYYMDLLDGITQPLPNARYPYSQNVLINGKNNFDCSTTSLGCLEDAGLAVFNLTSGKSHRVRLVNTAADATMKVSLDDHTFEVIANDFVEIEPYNTTVVTLGIGQRSDVIIHANQNSNSSYWMRVVAPSPCANNNGTNYAQAAFYYEGADRSKAPTSTAQIGYDNSYCGNDPLSSTVPFYSITPGDAATTDDIAIKAASNGSHGLWYLDGVSAILDYNDPTLLEAKSGNTSYTPQQNVHNYGTNSSVRFVVQNGSPAAHPMHLHGHNMFVLAEGVGVWDGIVVNANNPQRRDVQLIQPGGYLVVQWNQDNPGSWPFHCHIAWHLSLGMSLQILEEPGEIKSSVNIPQAVNQVCSDWWSYTNSLVPPNLVDQIDSGI